MSDIQNTNCCTFCTDGRTNRKLGNDQNGLKKLVCGNCSKDELNTPAQCGLAALKAVIDDNPIKTIVVMEAVLVMNGNPAQITVFGKAVLARS